MSLSAQNSGGSRSIRSSATSPPSQKMLPMAAACSSTRRSTDESAAMRAATASSTVIGSRHARQLVEIHRPHRIAGQRALARAARPSRGRCGPSAPEGPGCRRPCPRRLRPAPREGRRCTVRATLPSVRRTDRRPAARFRGARGARGRTRTNPRGVSISSGRVAHQEQNGSVQVLDQVAEQLDRIVVGELQVLEDQADRALCGVALDEALDDGASQQAGLAAGRPRPPG